MAVTFRPMRTLLPAATAILTLATTALAAGSGSRGLLWKAASGKGVVYLLGSIHIADESIYPLSPAIEEAFAASDALVVEAETGPSSEVALKAFLLGHGVYVDGSTLESHMSPAALEAVKGFAAARGLAWDQLRRMRPWLLAGTLTVTEMGRSGAASRSGPASPPYGTQTTAPRSKPSESGWMERPHPFRLPTR
jgi:hypothetical protein